MNVRVLENPGTMTLLPAAPGTCPICATKHEPELPHNKDSLYYQFRFEMENGRGATWEDAMAHCSEEMKARWREELKKHGVDLDKEKAPTEAATSNVGTNSRTHLKDSTNKGGCQI